MHVVHEHACGCQVKESGELIRQCKVSLEDQEILKRTFSGNVEDYHCAIVEYLLVHLARR